jgi:hypothetical protein
MSGLSVFVLDLDGNSNLLEFDGVTFRGSDLFAQLASVLDFDWRLGAVVFQKRIVETTRIFKEEDFENSDPFVLFDYRLYPEKAYPKVDIAFGFGGARYGEYALDLPTQHHVEEELRLMVGGPARHPSRFSTRVRQAILQGMPQDALGFARQVLLPQSAADDGDDDAFDIAMDDEHRGDSDQGDLFGVPLEYLMHATDAGAGYPLDTILGFFRGLA